MPSFCPEIRRESFTSLPSKVRWVTPSFGEFERDPGDLDTFYIVTDYRSSSPRLLSKSQAGLFVLAQIGGIWKLAGVLKVLPRPLRDAVYDFVARHRYRVFGRYDTCPIPSAEHKNRFIGL